MTIQKLTVDHYTDKIEIAYVKTEGESQKPTIIFCGGFRSDMSGKKALFLEGHAQEHGYNFIRFDYMGHGQSGGAFKEGTLSSWTQDTQAIIKDLTPNNDLILIGSSMGGWISLLCAIDLKEKVKGLIGIAAAPDFDKDLVPDGSELMKKLNAQGSVKIPSGYEEPYIVTRALIEDAQTNHLLDTGKPIDVTCPVILLQGKKDLSVSSEQALTIQDHLESDNVDVTLIKDGDHSLSRPQDLALLGQSVQRVMPSISSYN